jgi:phosphatidylglycerophosphatase C
MPHRGEPANSVLERLRQAFAEQPTSVVATDGDGTLWSGDIGEDYLFGMIAQRAIGEAAVPALRDFALACGLDTRGPPHELAQRLYDAYARHEAPEDRICEMIAWLAAGATHEEVYAFCDALLRSRGLLGRLHPEMQEVLGLCTELGVPVYLVSASPLHVVTSAARLLGIPEARVIAVEPAAEHGRVVADVRRPIPYDKGKAHLLGLRTSGAPVLAAFGDNAFDVPMLAMAQMPFAVRPKERLLARAAEVPGLRQILPR